MCVTRVFPGVICVVVTHRRQRESRRGQHIPSMTDDANNALAPDFAEGAGYNSAAKDDVYVAAPSARTVKRRVSHFNTIKEIKCYI